MLPIVFTVGDFPVYAYGLMLGLSLLLGWYLLVRADASDTGLDSDQLGNVYLIGAVAAVLGARALYVLVNLDSFESAGQWLNLRQGGLMAYGGLLGGGLLVALAVRRMGGRLGAVADATAPAMAGAMVLTGLGSYLHGSDFGVRLAGDGPAFLQGLGTFPRWMEGEHVTGSPPYLRHLTAGWITRDAQTSLPVHPTQLYDMAAGMALFGLCRWGATRSDFHGRVFLSFLMTWSVWRLFAESLRDDLERGQALGFSTTQLLSLVIFPIAAITYNQLRNAARQAPQPTSAA